MYIIDLTYIRPLEQIDEAMTDHIAYVEKYFKIGTFICSGRKNPRTGGIILAKAQSLSEVEAVVSEDPFLSLGLVSYTITEFVPTRWGIEFEPYLG